MYSNAFDYFRAASVEDAQRLLAEHPGAKLIAGGHSLLPAMKLRLSAPPALIDIGGVSALRGISPTRNGYRIGALTTHAEIAASADLQHAAPALVDAAGHVGDPAVRNRGTIGGNIAHADPASDLPTVLVALDATITTTRAQGGRDIAAEEFFRGLMLTALEDDEIVETVRVPTIGSGRTSAYVKFPHPASRYAVIGCAAVLTRSGGTCSEARVAVGGLVPHARRLPAVEAALIGKPLDDQHIREAAAKTSADLGDEVIGDIYASADYRARVAPVYVARAISAAAGR